MIRLLRVYWHCVTHWFRHDHTPATLSYTFGVNGRTTIYLCMCEHDEWFETMAAINRAIVGPEPVEIWKEDQLL